MPGTRVTPPRDPNLWTNHNGVTTRCCAGTLSPWSGAAQADTATTRRVHRVAHASSRDVRGAPRRGFAARAARAVRHGRTRRRAVRTGRAPRRPRRAPKAATAPGTTRTRKCRAPHRRCPNDDRMPHPPSRRPGAAPVPPGPGVACGTGGAATETHAVGGNTGRRPAWFSAVGRRMVSTGSQLSPSMPHPQRGAGSVPSTPGLPPQSISATVDQRQSQ
jgi:hypothetical protein